jgi:hypothetical protein
MPWMATEGSDADSAAREHGLKPIEVLLIGRVADGGQLPGDLGALEFLPPGQKRLIASWRECHGQSEPRLTDVLDQDACVRLNLAEYAFIGIVRPVRSVHDEHPISARLELELLKRVGEAVGAPPLCELVGILECRKDLARGGCNQTLGAQDRTRAACVGD